MDTPSLMVEAGPDALRSGTRIGNWRLSALRGRGTYGAVYSAVSADVELAALKLAIYPRDPRFEREVELLCRIRHPGVPRLLDAGWWRHPVGRLHPYLVMEWVEGVSLYAWAAARNPSSRQVLGLLAQAARALQATHEVSGVHRDIKGTNVLVRPTDGRLFLTDFGSGYFSGASRLTPLPMLPGTPAYRSPEAWYSIQSAGPLATSPALARPADDVFSLGVMAYRLVTNEYPPFTNPHLEEGRCWRPGGGGPRPPRQLNPRVDAQLNALILRMLSVQPAERGTAGELAEAMERGVAHAGPSADAPLFERETRAPEAAQADATAHDHGEQRQAEEPARTVVSRVRRWLPWLTAVGALWLWPAEPGSVRTEEYPSMAHDAKRATSVGDTALSASAASSNVPNREAIALEIPKQPLPGQRKPDGKGRCIKHQIALNGGCWWKVDLEVDDCPGTGYVYQGGCYIPIFLPGRQPTSAPR
ncbi:serine/threonine protein kinase [Hyalangium rubrum]|uniref:Serine/threonine-protein kinase n=1 Tax=Hyalangium rubrum TaxID=3103134 RepID=A0ABU5GYB5_9BACT|nr:serine/threonine-protein kinase [Hyalangium sp. s54d21]MDY7226036.1 serine/threonine-protein kinase [Hyalangium sp. s54d21]